MVTGEGFSRKDSCGTMCVNWEVQCNSGVSGIPHVCAGFSCQNNSDCAADFSCVRLTDAPDGNYCMPDRFCTPQVGLSNEDSLDLDLSKDERQLD